METEYTGRFLRSLKKLPVLVQNDVIEAVDRYNANDTDQLFVHKLKGKMKGYLAFSANFAYRVIFKKEKNKTIFLDVGDHDVYE